jgi:D-galactose 1-dehydrogenase
MPIKIGLVGVGFIAHAQHIPALNARSDFELVATASPERGISGVVNFQTCADMLAGAPQIEAVVLCTPAAVRAHDARLALNAGKHVLLEKPPGATIAEVEALRALAARVGRTLHASWHSRHAAGVAPAKAWLAERQIERVDIDWREDVRRWHPGQDWIFAPGGLGVFDPGINALSLATAILPAFSLREAVLTVPENRQAPSAATLAFAGAEGWPINVEFDFLETGPQTWDIRVQTSRGDLVLRRGGADLQVDGRDELAHAGEDVLRGEYHSIYNLFARHIATSAIDVDLSPLVHVADAMMLGERRTGAPFYF